MSKARAQFLTRLAAFRAAGAADVLVSKAPTEIEHNARAQILRNGLAITGFALLEDFVKSRLAEILQRIGSGQTPFSNLPPAIRDGATAGVVRALRFQDQYLDKKAVDYHAIYQAHARAIASTGASPFEISVLAFANDQANISADTLGGVLDAFRIDTPWSAMGSVASRCNVGVLDLKTAMSAAANRRR